MRGINKNPAFFMELVRLQNFNCTFYKKIGGETITPKSDDLYNQLFSVFLLVASMIFLCFISASISALIPCHD